ncbi:radical SAM protein [Proteinivorax hydrogeniformans]|uniref:Radical SAM protein n=1 Tax=Proteinivorax hydrogeniformans TaxID=1826727 RepID=A0AAU8HW20_9FIRM
MNSLYVNKIIDFSFVDGPGNRLAIFLQGCNLNCGYCHNPETIPDAKVNSYTVQQLYDYIAKRKDFITGITVSGGECTLQWQALIELFSLLKRETALTIFIDSNGNIDSEGLSYLLPLTDAFMLDIKAIDDDVHHQITKTSNEVILETVRAVHKQNKLYELRYVLIPGINDSVDDLKKLANFVLSLGDHPPLVLIPYRNHGVKGHFKSIPSMEKKQYNYAKETLSSQGLKKIIEKNNFFTKK